MAKSRRIASSFAELCAGVWRSRGYVVSFDARPVHDMVAFSGKSSVSSNVFVATVYSPGKTMTLAALRNHASRLKAHVVPRLTPLRKLLIVSSILERENSRYIEAEFDIDVWGRNELVSEASKGARREAIRAFFEEYPGIVAMDSSFDLASNFSTLLQDLPSAGTKPPDDVRGTELAERLRAIQPGKAGASDYERTCSDIIDYLFGDFLLDARPQSRLEDNLSILDVVYRVKPGDMFWDTLTRDFRARLIAFECKNYADMITPDQVHSTERYVNASALRPICIMVSRKGANKQAELTAFGAMREGGKLFVFLSDSDLEQMLSVRDAQIRKQIRDEQSTGDGPTVVLDQKIYDFLSRMAR